MALSIAESGISPEVRRVKLDKYSLTLIDAASLIPNIEFDIINDLYTYKLLDNFSLSKKDTKSIIYHHLILGLCSAIKANTGSVYTVIAYDSSLRFLPDYVMPGDQFIFRAFRKLDNVLPVAFVELPYDFGTITRILDSNDGEGIELDYKLKKLTSNRKPAYSFDRMLKFSRKYGLDFLMNNFFRKVENKLLIIS